MLRPLFLLLACLTFGVAACVFGKPMMVWELNSECLFTTGGSGREDDICGGAKVSICKDFEDTMSEKFASRDQCLAKCRELRESLYPKHIVDGCLQSVGNAFTLCGQFCSRNYP